MMVLSVSSKTARNNSQTTESLNNKKVSPQQKPSFTKSQLPALFSHSKNLGIDSFHDVCQFHWQNQWKNLHFQYKSYIVKKLLEEFLLKRKLWLNHFYIHKYHGGLRVTGNTLGFYVPKLAKILKRFKRRTQPFQKSSLFFQKRRPRTQNIRFATKWVDQPKSLKDYMMGKTHPNQLIQLAKAFKTYAVTEKAFLCISHYYLPKTYIVWMGEEIFGRYRSIQNFWEGLQLIRCLVENQALAHLLAKFIYQSVRRNPKRAAFIVYLKRLIDWHFVAHENVQIQGIRVEVKGRFNAKSRSRKYILSVGRVAKQEKRSNLDYAFLDAITPFGSLGIKTWICAYKKNNATTTTKNKV